MNKQITIFCASSPGIPDKYFEATRQLTELLVNNHYDIIYGGGATGLMGTVADTTLKMGGHIKGVIPKFMIDVEWEHKGVKEMVHVEDMRHRKELLTKDTNAVVALPGGTGTLEELYEVVSLKKLGFFPHPIVLLNTDGYFNPLAQMASKMVAENFMQQKHLEIWQIVNTPAEVIEAINNHKPWGPEVINFAAVQAK